MQHRTMRRMLAIAMVTAVTVAGAACAPAPPPVDTLDLDGFGSWSAPSATIDGQHYNAVFTGTPAGDVSTVSFGVTASVAAVEQAELTFRIESLAEQSDLSPGTWTLRAWEPLQVMFINGPGLTTPVMALTGSLTIQSVAYGPPTAVPNGETRPITHLRATFSATFDAPVGLVNGSVSIG